jgi:phage terminase, large subunit, PBSX family|nr:MAG TPA: terminase large subunit [Caudoviricetes sp.]
MAQRIRIQSNKAFSEVHKSTKRYIALKGSAGSGKSVDTAQQYLIRLLKDKGRNLVCIRKSDVTNRDSTYAELTGAIYRLGLEKYFECRLSPLQIRCINGNMIIFRGVNDEKQREKLKSITFQKGKLTDVWIEEATELTQSDFEIIDDRLRGNLPSGQFYQIKMTFNPVNKNHWIKKQFFDRQDENTLTCHSSYLDNRFIDDAYKARMKRRKEIDPDGYRIYGLGDWGEIGGLVLKNWEVADISQNANDYDDVAIGQDFGFNHANAILQLAIKDDDIYILKEIYVYEKDTSEIIDIADTMDLVGKMWCDSAEPDRIKTWKKAGYKAEGVTKEKTTGQKYQATQIDWLKRRKIYIHPSCVNTMREIEQWKWKRDEQSGKYLDEPVPFFDDAMAALRYGIEGWRKPSTVKLKTFKEGI